MRAFSFNGIRSDQFSIYVSSDTFLNSPGYAYEAYEVPSRNGALLKYDKHLQNVVRQFNCFCKDNVIVNLDAFKQALYANSGYMRIESDYDPDTYQMGYLAEGIEVEPFDASGDFSAQFTITFSCKPQKWFKNVTTETVTVHEAGIYKVLKRTDTYIQKMFNALPISAIPEGDTFYLISVYKKPATSLQISASMSTGGFLALCGEKKSGAFDGVKLYSSNGDIPLQDATIQSSVQFRWVTNQPSGILNEFYSLTSSGETDVSDTSTINAGTPVTVTNSDALGASVSAVAFPVMPFLVTNPKPLFLNASGTLDGVQTWEMFVRVGFDLMSTSELTDIDNNWLDSNYHGCDLVIDLTNLSVYLSKDGEKYILDEYTEIDGAVGMCNSVTIHTVGYSSTAATLRLTANVEWWKV